MHSERFDQLLDRAAGDCGIDAGFWDIWGRYHDTSAEAKQAILHAKGVAAESAEALERSLAERERRSWQRLVPPVVIAGEADFIEVPVHAPAELQAEPVRVTVR